MLPTSSLTLQTEKTSLTIVNQDERAVMHLIEELLTRSNLTPAELARRMGIHPQTLNQYRYMRRKHPSIQWLTKLVEICGGRIWIEMPTRSLGAG